MVFERTVFDLNNINSMKKSILLMAICAMLWSTGGVFVKMITWSPLLIAGLRSLTGAFIIAAYMIYKGIPLKVCRYSLGAAAGLSVCCNCYVIAAKLTTAANAIVLQYSAPVFILIISAVFLRQRLQKKDTVVVAVTMCGIVMFFLDQISPGNMIGNAFGILSGIGMAVMFVMTGRAGGDDSIRMSGLLLAQLLTSIVSIPTWLAATTSISGTEIIYVLILGVFQLGIPYVLYGIASKDCPPLACSLIGMLEPIFNPIWVGIFLGEVPGITALVGGIIIIMVVAWWCVSDNMGVTARARSGA